LRQPAEAKRRRGAALTEIFISHSSRARPQASAFISALGDALAGRAFLDVADLHPGDEWRPKLYRELAACEGAVLVLDAEALASPWVRKEATIIAWRRALRAYSRRTMPVVVALFDGVTRADVRGAFPALHLDDLEFLEPSGDQPAEATVEDVLRLLPPTTAPLDDPLQWWTSMVTEWLTTVLPGFLQSLEEQLELPSEDWDVRARCYAIADALLHRATFEQVYRALSRILQSGALNSRDVINCVLPVTVPVETSAVLLEAMRRDRGERVAALNATHVETGALLVQRATCCDDMVTVVVSPLRVSADEETLYAEVVATIGTAAGAVPPWDVRGEDLEDPIVPRLVVLLKRTTKDGEGLPLRVLRHLLARLRTNFPACVFLVLAGPRYDDLDQLVPHDLRATPPLDENEERNRAMAVNRLRSRAGLGRPA